MSSFDEAVATEEARLAAPVTEAKQSLAPVRADLVRLLQDCRTAAAAAGPTIADAQQKQQQAARVGIIHPELRRHLAELSGDGILPGLLEAAPATFEGSIRAIDTLSARDLATDPYAVTRLAAAPASHRGLIGALKKLTEALKRDLIGLEEMVRNAATLRR